MRQVVLFLVMVMIMDMGYGIWDMGASGHDGDLALQVECGWAEIGREIE